jgi:hypothetical protein
MLRPIPIERPKGRFYLGTLPGRLLFARVCRPLSDFEGFAMFFIFFFLFSRKFFTVLELSKFLLTCILCFSHFFSLKMGRDVVEQHV